jgi:hypothetical protein
MSVERKNSSEVEVLYAASACDWLVTAGSKGAYSFMADVARPNEDELVETHVRDRSVTTNSCVRLALPGRRQICDN